MAIYAESTVAQAILNASDKYGNSPALCKKADGTWQTISWRQYGQTVQFIALGLLSLGLNKGDRVCILGDNSPEWLYADMGTMSVGGVSVGIYATNAPQQVQYVINDCGARFLFVENEPQLNKILPLRGDLPSLEHIIVFGPLTGEANRDPGVIHLDDLLEHGKVCASNEPDLWRGRGEEIKPDDLAILIYTSGTTGPPKGAMLSHSNLMFQAECQSDTLPIAHDDVQISFLPFSHIGERLLGATRPLLGGSVVYFAESPLMIAENIREIAPTMFFGVPRFWEKFHAEITGGVEASGAIRQLAWKLAFKTGQQIAQCKMEEKEPSPLLKAKFKFADRMVLNWAKRIVGLQRTRYVICGGAPSSPELIEWFTALGIDMRQTYGLTESSGVVSIPPVGLNRIGTVGKALPSTDIRIEADGEILVQGRNVFQGYYGNLAKTQEAIEGEWLRTGDIGALDDQGYLKILGRKKDIIVTAGGKNISPSEIENQLKFSPYITEAMVIGDSRKFLSALIVIDPQNVQQFAREKGITGEGLAKLYDAPEVAALFQSEVDKVNAGFSRAEQIKKFNLIHHPLSPSDEALTPTLKLKREKFEEKYRDIVEAIYSEI